MAYEKYKSQRIEDKGTIHVKFSLVRWRTKSVGLVFNLIQACAHARRYARTHTQVRTHARTQAHAWTHRAGRVNQNRQDMRHECTTFGVESKCHICEHIEDGQIKWVLCAYVFACVRECTCMC